MKTNELVKHEPQPLAVVPSFNIESIFQLAIEKQGTAETLEKLMGIRRELNAEASKKAFDEAMARFQAECPIIQKRKSGAKNAYKYAPLDDIITQVRDIIRKHGFSFSVTSEIDPGWLKAMCKITHCSGHSEVSEFKVPIDNKNPMMSDPQRYGGAMTFAKRYAFANGFGILTADEDIDGVAARPKPAGPAQATEKTRNWFLEQTKDIHVKMQAYAIDNAIIMPDEGIDCWPLEQVPVSKSELDAFRRKVAAHV